MEKLKEKLLVKRLLAYVISAALIVTMMPSLSFIINKYEKTRISISDGKKVL